MEVIYILTNYFTSGVPHTYTQEYLHHAERFPDARGELPKVTDPEIKYSAVGPTKIATVENQEGGRLFAQHYHVQYRPCRLTILHHITDTTTTKKHDVVLCSTVHSGLSSA